jgi:hypothetical protein
MARFQLEIPHEVSECTRTLDEISSGARGSELLDQSFFGCASGVHTSWAVVEAPNEAAARNMIPEFLRKRARVVGVMQHTPETIRAMHKT